MNLKKPALKKKIIADSGLIGADQLEKFRGEFSALLDSYANACPGGYFETSENLVSAPGQPEQYQLVIYNVPFALIPKNIVDQLPWGAILDIRLHPVREELLRQGNGKVCGLTRN